MTNVQITPECYSRWLRAGSPPWFDGFVRMSEDQQEALALIGDDFRAQNALDLAMAVLDPEMARIAVDDDEAALAQRAARELAARVATERPARSSNTAKAKAPAVEAPTFAGLGERQVREINPPRRRLFGILEDRKA